MELPAPVFIAVREHQQVDYLIPILQVPEYIRLLIILLQQEAVQVLLLLLLKYIQDQLLLLLLVEIMVYASVNRSHLQITLRLLQGISAPGTGTLEMEAHHRMEMVIRLM